MISRTILSLSIMMISFNARSESTYSIIAQELYLDGEYSEAIAKCNETDVPNDVDCKRIISESQTKIKQAKEKDIEAKKKIAHIEQLKKEKLESKDCQIALWQETYCGATGSIKLLQEVINREMKIKSESGVYNMKTLHDSTNAKILYESRKENAEKKLNSLGSSPGKCTNIQELVKKSCY